MSESDLNHRIQSQTRRRKSRDRSIALLFIGFLLMLPPFGRISLVEGTLFGIPIPVVYIFSVWFLITIGACLLSRPLNDDPEVSSQDAARESDGS